MWVNVLGICWINNIGYGKFVGSGVSIFWSVMGLFVEVFIVRYWYFLFDVCIDDIVGWVIVFFLFDNKLDDFKKGCLGVLVGSLWVFICLSKGWFKFLFCCVINCILVYNMWVVFFLFLVIFLNFLGRKFKVFVLSVFKVVCVLWCVRDENIKIGSGCLVIIVLMVEILFIMGIFMFIVIIFGVNVLIFFRVFWLFLVLLIIFSFLLLLSILWIWWW